jgi:thioredoxin 1
MILTDANFDEEVLKAKGPVLVDFWATWCPPCRMIGPAIEAAADRFAGRAKVAKLDVDDSPLVAQRYGIRSIPTLLLFQDGCVVEQRVGALPPAEIEAMVERPLLAATAAR